MDTDADQPSLSMKRKSPGLYFFTKYRPSKESLAKKKSESRQIFTRLWLIPEDSINVKLLKISFKKTLLTAQKSLEGTGSRKNV